MSLKLAKWTSGDIKKHLKYLKELDTKHPKTMSRTKLFWRLELDKRINEEKNNDDQDNN